MTTKGRLVQYLILLALLLGAGLFVLYYPYLWAKYTAIGFIVVTYLIWAIWHHYQDGTLTRQTIFEYIGLLCLIALVLVLLS
jgi:hypothetical protein